MAADYDTLDLAKGADQLGRLLQDQKLIIMAGSGVSVAPPSSLPTWDQLLEKFIEFCRLIQSLPMVPATDRFDEVLNEATTQAADYPTRVASVLRDKLREIDAGGQINVTGMFTRWLTDLFYFTKFNSNHELIVNTNYPYILTTNYDRLLELAADASGHRALSAYSYTFQDADKVAGAIYSKLPAIIHIHGDATSIVVDDFVFTAEDYVRILREHKGFTLAIQTLMMSYSIVFVGYGGSDPHLETLLEEICYFFRYSQSNLLPRFYLVLKREKAGRILNQYKGKLRTTLIRVDDYSETSEFLRLLQERAPRPTV